MKKILLAGLLALAIAAGAQNVSAANWVEIANSPKTVFFIDTESIRQIDASTYSMWYKTSNSDGSYELSLGYFDTQQVAFIISSVVAYDANGNVIGSETRKPYEYILNWQPIIPSTISEALYSYATGSSAY